MPKEWDKNAAVRAMQIEAGLDLTFSKVFLPYYLEFVGALKPARVVEIGAGTGHLAQELSSLAQNYVAVEPSANMHAFAVSTLKSTNVEIFCSTAQGFATTGQEFDLVLSHLCLQAVEDLPSFLGAVSMLTESKGRFMLSIPHPAFYNDYKCFFDRERFAYMEGLFATVSFSITLDPMNEIRDVPYFHRPISTYVRELRRAGLLLDTFDEIYPSASVQALYKFPWKRPRYLVLSGIKSI